MHSLRSGPGAYPQGPLPWSGWRHHLFDHHCRSLPRVVYFSKASRGRLSEMELPFVFEGDSNMTTYQRLRRELPMFNPSGYPNFAIQ